MAVCHVHVNASPEAVFAVIADPTTYPEWLVGAKMMRRVDANWPEPGSRFHHRFGVGPLTIDDSSTLEEIDPPKRLVLKVRARPVGKGRVTFTVVAVSNGSTVTLEEHPVEMPFLTILAPLLDPTVHMRNQKSLHQLRQFSERAGR